MVKKETKKTNSATEIAKKQRIASLVNRIKQGKPLNPSEIRELELYEKKTLNKISKPRKIDPRTHITEKQKTFCREYLVDLSPGKAAKRAGYSKRTASAQASRLLTLVKIQDYIKKYQDERAERTNITADRVLKELGKIAFSNIGEFIHLVDSDGFISMKTLESLTKEQMACISEMSEYETDRGARRFKFKLHDKIKGLELIGKHLSMFNENINHKFPDGCGVLMVAPDMDKNTWSQLAKEKQSRKPDKNQT